MMEMRQKDPNNQEKIKLSDMGHAEEYIITIDSSLETPFQVPDSGS
jgi:hypothetical protein